jgi:hypothetical protein
MATGPARCMCVQSAGDRPRASTSLNNSANGSRASSASARSNAIEASAPSPARHAANASSAAGRARNRGSARRTTSVHSTTCAESWPPKPSQACRAAAGCAIKTDSQAKSASLGREPVRIWIRAAAIAVAADRRTRSWADPISGTRPIPATGPTPVPASDAATTSTGRPAPTSVGGSVSSAPGRPAPAWTSSARRTYARRVCSGMRARRAERTGDSRRASAARLGSAVRSAWTAASTVGPAAGSGRPSGGQHAPLRQVIPAYRPP